MTNLPDNPYAAPAEPADAVCLQRPVPLSNYGYALAMFFFGGLGGAFGGLLLSLPLLVLGVQPRWIALAVAMVAMLAGFRAGQRIWRKLAQLHADKQAWRTEQLERLGESFEH